MRKSLSIIKRSYAFLTALSTRQVLQKLVLSHLDYCSVVCSVVRLLRYSLILKCFFLNPHQSRYMQYPIMTMWKQVLRNVCKCIKNKKQKFLIYMYSDPLLWDSKLSSGASCFHLDFSSTWLESTCGTFGKAHTCPYVIPQLTVHVRANTKPWGQRKTRQDCVEAQSWGRVPKYFWSIEGRQEHSDLHNS